MKQRSIRFQQLVAYASGELEGQEAAQVEAYLARWSIAAGDVTRLRETLEIMRSDDSEEPTPEAVGRALAVVARSRKPVAPRRPLAGLDRILTRLVFDSRAQLAIPGYRGPASSYQLAYECEQGRIDLHVLPTSPVARGWYRIRGQVAWRSKVDSGFVCLIKKGADEPVESVMSDQHGRFRVDAPPGVYDLLIEVAQGDQVLVASDLDLG